MLNEQEMQFADPDWKPTGPLSALPTGPLLTQPVNSVVGAALPVSPHGSASGQTYDASQIASLPAYSQGYQGAWQDQTSSSPQFPGMGLAAQQGGYRTNAQRGRRSAHWWVWVIIVIVCISLASGIFHSTVHSYHGPKNPFPISRPMPAPNKQVFGLNGATQLDINDLSGDITVQVANDVQSVIVNTSDGSQPQVNYLGQSMELTSNGNGPMTVFVPQNVALQLSAGENNIDVDGFSGQLTAQTGSGQIVLQGDNLSQGSSLNTNSGNISIGQESSVSDTSITSTNGAIILNGTNLSGTVTISTGGNGLIIYNGALDPRGKYQFSTASGSINLTFPHNTSMQLKVSQKSGHYNNDFPPSTGSAPQASVGVTTNNGDITISEQ